MKKDDDISRRIIQDGSGDKRLGIIAVCLLGFLLVAGLGASLLWMNYDKQAQDLFYGGEADMRRGSCAQAREKGHKAAEQMKLALQFNKFVRGESHSEIANDTLNLARCYDLAGEWDKARDVHEQACALFLKSKGPQDAEYAWSLLSFGDHYSLRRDKANALEYFNKALPIIVKAHGTGSNEYTWTLQRIEIAKKLQ